MCWFDNIVNLFTAGNGGEVKGHTVKPSSVFVETIPSTSKPNVTMANSSITGIEDFLSFFKIFELKHTRSYHSEYYDDFVI